MQEIAAIARVQAVGRIFKIAGAQAMLRKRTKRTSGLIGQHARATANLDLCVSRCDTVGHFVKCTRGIQYVAITRIHREHRLTSRFHGNQCAGGEFTVIRA